MSKKTASLRNQKEEVFSTKINPIAKVKKTRIKVIGIGGGAGMIISEIASEIKQACFVAANTDAQALKTVSKKVGCFQFGQALTCGLGTGMNPEKGKEAAQNEKERIKKLCQGQDICIIIACLGGGTGSGAASVFAKISKELNNLTYGIFTLPFKFEGEKKMEISREALAEIKNYLNAMTIIPNERVFQVIDKETPLKQSFSFINKNLAENLKGLIETIYNPGLINIDFADIRTIFEGQGKLVYLNTVETSRAQARQGRAQRQDGAEASLIKEGSVKDLTARLLNSPLYPYKIQGAKGVLFNIAGERNLSLSEVNQISKSISELVSPEAKIIFGISQKRKYPKTIKAFLLAVGCLGEKAKFNEIKISSTRASRSAQRIERSASEVRISKKDQSPTKLAKKIKEKEKIKIKGEKVKIKINKKRKKKILTEIPINTEIKPIAQASEGRRKDEVSSTKVTDIKKEKVGDETSSHISRFASLRSARVRKNGLQIKKEAQDIEREILEKEKFWETPAFLRRKKT